MEYDPYAVETTRNYNTGTGTRQNISAQAKERNRQAIQRRKGMNKGDHAENCQVANTRL